MPAKKRFKTQYPGVYYIQSAAVGSGKPEKIFYITYRKNGKLIEEKAGRQYQDDMTPARAAHMRGERVHGNELSNKEQREAERAAKEAEAAKWTIGRLWEEYKKQRPDSKGLRTDDNRYKNHIKAQFGDQEPEGLVQLDVDRLRIKLLKKKKPQTVWHVLALLQRIINFGANKQLCRGAGFKIEKPWVNNLKTEDLTPDQLASLLTAIEKDKSIQAGNMMRLALFTGLRRGEMFKLKWNDIDFERGFIHIRDPKGGLDQKIPLNDATRELLESHPRPYPDSPFVFPGRGGGQRTDVNHQVNRIKKEAGLPKDFRPLHGLRHCYASMLASSGQVDMYTLQKLLTHKNPKTTQRYAHLRDETLKQAAELAGSIVKEAANKKDQKQVVRLDEHKN